MTRLALVSSLALAVAAPAFANPQLAASLGLDAGAYTTAELVAIASAREDDNHVLAKFLVNGGSDVVSTQSGVSAGHEQLARSLGLDASEYSLNDLAAIAADRSDD